MSETYKGNTLTWKNGRELATFGNYSFDYDANGIRVRKANGTTVTNYIVDGSTVLRQSWISGSNSYVADYIYSEAGTPLAFALSTNGGDYVYYFYETNIQGDVIAIYNSSWTKLAAFYYDAWGKFTEGVFNTTGYTSAVKQGSLFRYRGYIYDIETQLYYLQTRYYDPQTSRFINSDIQINDGLVGGNLYIYCNNNPIVYVDYSGRDAIYVVRYGLTSGGIPIVGHAELYIQDENGNWYKTEYAGSDKTNAKIWLDEYSDEMIEELLNGRNAFQKFLSQIHFGSYRYEYLEGDFTQSLKRAQELKKTNYGGYNLLTNNCLDYVQELLKLGKHESNINNFVINNFCPTSPRIEHMIIDLSNELTFVWGFVNSIYEEAN